jgi:SAM-dependent methyltransferase
MTSHEIAQHLFMRCLPVLYGECRSELQRLLLPRRSVGRRLLDVGGRASIYTVGLDADVTVVDLPRASDVQSILHLGFSEKILHDLRKKRSNIKSVVIGDVMKVDLPHHGFDVISCVEVIEHIADDNRFVSRLSELMAAGGCAFLTTPNGDYNTNEPPNYNPDHFRHYTKDQFENLLGRHFEDVLVWYAVKTGKHRYRGLVGISPSRPFSSLLSAVNNLYNLWESRGLEETPRRTAHLFAVAARPRSPST